jgi:hypothetical protein
MFKYVAPSLVIVGCLMHLFCCGIPLLLSLTSLATTLGLSSGSMLGAKWYQQIEQELVLASGVVLFFTLLAHLIGKKLSCGENGGCSSAPCDRKKSFSFKLLLGASGLYLLNMFVLLLK